MKKANLYILSLIIALLSLTGCKVQTVEQYNAQNANEKSVNVSNEKVIPINDKKTTTTGQQSKDSTENTDQLKKINTNKKEVLKNKKESNTAQKDTNSSQKETKSSKTETNTIKKETVQTKKETNSPKKETNQKKKDSQSSKKVTIAEKNNTSSKSSKDLKGTVKEKKKYVTITVRADTLLKEENYNKLDESLQNEKYVPKNGIIVPISTYQILNDDETAWNITVRALKENHIHFEYRGANETKYGSVYIESINHLGEMDAGKLSGWMYSVNGKNPGLGSSNYTVKDGDQIIWQYTVDQGTDIGL